MDDKVLLAAAFNAMESAYVPYSNFRVGAAVMADSGKIFTGCNIENASYGASNCAERTAIFKAVSEGHQKFKKIAIVSSSGDFTFPCGICRQVLTEFMLDGEILLGNHKGEIKFYKVSEILPFAFTKEELIDVTHPK